MRRLGSLALAACGDMALATLEPRIAAVPALVSFLGAGLVLISASPSSALTQE